MTDVNRDPFDISPDVEPAPHTSSLGGSSLYDLPSDADPSAPAPLPTGYAHQTYGTEQPTYGSEQAQYPGPGPYPGQGQYPGQSYPAPGVGYGPGFPGAPLASQSTDGLSIAALITGILGMGPIPLVLGILGLNRIKRTGDKGRGMSIAGIILGGLSIIGWGIVIAFAVWAGNNAGGLLSGTPLPAGVTWSNIDSTHVPTNPILAGFWRACDAGDMAACDDLYRQSGFNTLEDLFGDSCGGRREPDGQWCAG